MEESAGEGSDDLLWQDGGTESLEEVRFDWRKQIVLRWKIASNRMNTQQSGRGGEYG